MKPVGKERKRVEGEAGQVSKWQDDFDNPSLLRDKYGNKYELSTEEYSKMLEQRKPSRHKEIELIVAREILESKLNKLTDKQRSVIYYKLMGISDREIAKTMRIETITVRKHLDAARKKLAEHINRSKKFLEEGLDNE